MNVEQALRVMGHIAPALIEETRAKKKRHLPGVARTALIAACLCVLLAGTVLAVETATGVRITEFFTGETVGSILSRIDPEYQEKRQTGETYSGYVAERGNKGVSLENVPEEIVEKVKDAPYTLFEERFDSQKEAEGYFALDPYDNAYLEQMSRNLNTPCAVMYSGDEEGLICLTMNSNFVAVSHDGGDAMNTVNVSVQAELFRQGYEQPDVAYFYPEGSEITQETYTFGDGAEGELLHISQPETAVEKGYTWHCVHFEVNGVRYYVSAKDQSSEAYSLMVLKAVLENFAFYGE